MCMIVYVDGLVFLVIVVSDFHSAKISSSTEGLCSQFERYLFPLRYIIAH